jgi:hypothetical protein
MGLTVIVNYGMKKNTKIKLKLKFKVPALVVGFRNRKLETLNIGK